MKWWQADGWPTAEEWQAVWAFVTLLVAIVAAGVALKQHSTSVRSRLEQARPYVTVDLVFNSTLISFEVTNSGLTAAKDIGFTWSDRPIAEDAAAQATIDRNLIGQGIPFLAPGRSIRYYFHDFTEELSPRQYRVQMKYTGSGDGEDWTSESILDLDQWARASMVVDPAEAAAQSLDTLARSLPKSQEPVKKAAELLRYFLDGRPETELGREKERALYQHRAELHKQEVRLSRMERGEDPDTAELKTGVPDHPRR